MPLPQNHSLTTNEIEAAVDRVLEKTGLLPREEASKALKNCGLSVSELAVHLANLIYSAKDSTKLNAIRDAFALHGISLKADEASTSTPTIIFNVQGENVNLNQMFAPDRGF